MYLGPIPAFAVIGRAIPAWIRRRNRARPLRSHAFRRNAKCEGFGNDAPIDRMKEQWSKPARTTAKGDYRRKYFTIVAQVALINCKTQPPLLA
jgi:hypothetical protein